MVAREVVGALVIGGLALALCGCGANATPPPTPVATFAPPPTPTVPEIVQAIAQHGPSWLDSCPDHTGKVPASFFLTSYPGTVQEDGYCTTFVQHGAHGDLVSFRAQWTAPPKYGGSGDYTLTYLMPRSANATTLPQLVGQKGTPP